LIGKEIAQNLLKQSANALQVLVPEAKKAVEKMGAFIVKLLQNLGSIRPAAKQKAAAQEVNESEPDEFETDQFEIDEPEVEDFQPKSKTSGKLDFLKRSLGKLSLKNFSFKNLALDKKPPVFFITCGIVVFLLILITIAVALSTGGQGVPSAALPIHAISQDELFIPAEPDFIPGFIPEREPRQFWSIEDILPHWTAPGAPDFWQSVIQSAVDEIMENVR